MKGDHKHSRTTRGATGGGYARPRVQIGFDPEMLREIERRANTNDRSFAAEVRDLIDAGLARKKKPWREYAAQAIGG